MNWTTYLIECVVMMAAFGCLVFGLLLISPLTFISDYPPEIQERYYRSQHKEAAKARLTKLMLAKKLIALVVWVFLFAWMAHKAGAATFLEGLLSVYGYILVLAAFDTLVLDWLLFPNIKRARLPGTENMDREYHQKWFHVKVMLPLVPLAVILGMVIALLMTWIW
ncbi:MAG: hypothetical protein NC041_10095 [Bacteroides sp.]|nr:hypothetical protein [Prevotella sp.]MCM1470803.1 hypothetical protein [Bacteroides sp.]